MYCSECGKSAQGKFCWNCGHPLSAAPGGSAVATTAATPTRPSNSLKTPEPHSPVPEPHIVAEGELIEAELIEDWETEVRYEALVRLPKVRATIERHAAQAPRRASGEEFLQVAEKLIPNALPYEKLATVAQPISASLGIGTRKEQTKIIDAPVGRVMVRALCSLARRGQALRGIRQAADCCSLEAVLPSDFRSFDGELLISLERRHWKTAVTAATKIQGQLFDWGKSRRTLDEFFADLELDPA